MVRRKRKIDFEYNLKEYWNILKRHKKYFFSLMFITLIVEALFVVDRYLFKVIVDGGAEFITGTLSKALFIQILLIVLAVFVGVSLIRTVGAWFRTHFSAILDSELMLDLKGKYFEHIIGLSHNFHTTHKTGSLISRMARGAGAIETMTDIIMGNFAPMLFQLIIVGFAIAYFSITPALVLVGIVILFISSSFIIQQIQQTYKLKYNDSEDRERGFISDVFTNIDSVKYLGKEKFINKKFSKFIGRTRKAAVKYWSYYRWFDSIQILILSIGTLVLIYFPLMDFLAGEITIGTLVFIYTVYGSIVGPLFGFVWGIRGFYRAMADFQYLFEYGKIKNDIKDRPNAKELKINKGSIEFRHMDFNYKKRRKIFKNFNLKIKPNEKVALVGHSGCGKTTIVKLLYRLYDVAAGEIMIDGKDIEEFKQESLRSELSVVPQECVLFDETIYNNIAFSNPKASKEQVMTAIKLAQLDKVIKDFPRQEDTIVGERGVKLSGGEKQRVSIARAILADKKILVLDEATSSLDSETEHEIQQALQNLLKGRSSIMIAHRLSTIMNADRIIVMKAGKIVQEGKHNDLIKQPGEYKRLWNLQKGGYIK